MTAIVFAASALLSTSPIASANPVAPQADTPCSENLAGTLTRLPDGQSLLQCRNDPEAGYRWQPYTNIYPSSDRWLSYGPPLKLFGQARRNPEFMAGRWVGYPQDAESQCSAEQVPVVRAGELGPPQDVPGKPGQPLEFAVSTQLFTITLTGYCKWQKAG